MATLVLVKEKLPRLAMVAFAARGARRVLPLWRAFANPSNETGVDAAIRVAESVGGGARVDLSALERLLNSTRSAANAARNAATHAGESAAANATEAASSCQAASRSAESAGEAIRTASAIFNERLHAGVASFAGAAVELACYAAEDSRLPGALRLVTQAQERDFDLIREAARRENWTDDAPVPPGFFGPMWPDGPPEGWPQPEPAELHIEVDLSAGVTDEQAAELVRERVAAMDAYHRALGGDGIEVRTVEAECPAGAEVPA